MWGQLTVSPAYMTKEVGPIPECLNCGFDERAAANLCIKPYRVHHILIGGFRILFEKITRAFSWFQGTRVIMHRIRYGKPLGFGT